MLLSKNFPELFRKESYAVKLALYKNQQEDDKISPLLAERTIDGNYDKDYSLVPFGELDGRDEGEKFKEHNMVMGYTCYGAVASVASGKTGVTDILKNKSRQFQSPKGGVDEVSFSGYLAKTFTPAFLTRADQKVAKQAAKIFNYGGIQAGDNFFNHQLRVKNSDVSSTTLIYDGMPLFANPTNPHPSFAAGNTTAPGSVPTGHFIDMEKTIVDTGGYFNAFLLPPSYWALKRVITHYMTNMQYDDNDQEIVAMPDTVLCSESNRFTWLELMKSAKAEPTKDGNFTNVENVFLMPDGIKLQLVFSRFIVRNTWYVGKKNSRGIKRLKSNSPGKMEFDEWFEPDGRIDWISFDREWGFMISDWRNWCAGAYSADGSTAPTFDDVPETEWAVPPEGI